MRASKGRIRTILAIVTLVIGALAVANEAPMLRERVEAGELPPLEERLPNEPYVVPVLERIGDYGGTWRRLATGHGDLGSGLQRFVEEMLFHVGPELTITDNVLVRHELTVGEEETVFRGYLREGMRWSDGEPFTVDDIVFAYVDIAQYAPEGGSVLPPDWMVFDGQPLELTKIDDTTFEFRAAGPYPLLADFMQNPLRASFLVKNPKHYMAGLHPAYNPDPDLSDAEQWTELQQRNANLGLIPWVDDPARPSISPWITELYEPGQRHIMVRNPYYWKVDAEGNQLPYIDSIVSEIVESGEAIVTRIIAGEVDMQDRNLSFADMALLRAEEGRGDYRTLIWETAVTANPAIHLNWHAPEPTLRSLIRERDFRVALSHAIDRDEINEVIWGGLATPMHATVHPENRFAADDLVTLYTDFDPDLANELLDNLGLTERGRDGIRLDAEGNGISITVDVPQPDQASHLPTMELVRDYWRDVGIDLDINPVERSLAQTRLTSGQHQATVWWFDRSYVTIPFMSIIPIDEFVRYAPLVGQWVSSGGERGEAPEGDMARVLELWEEIKVTADEAARVELFRSMVRTMSENAWVLGTVGRTPLPVVAATTFRNIPERGVGWDYVPLTPKNTWPEQYFFEAR